MFALPRYEIYTKMTKKVLISIYNVAKSVPFFPSKATAISTSSYV